MSDTAIARPSTSSRRGWAFVSYAHEDEVRVRSIVDDMRSRGIDVWWDDLLRPGDEWGRVLRSKLTSAACVVVMWSSASVQSMFVESEVRAVLDQARGRGRLVPVLLDKDAESDIPLPFNVFQHHDLSGWDGRTRRPLATLAASVTALVKRPPPSEEQWGPNLGDDYSVRSATMASTEMRDLAHGIGSIAEVLVRDADAVEDLRAALDEVHKTIDVVEDAVEDFITAGLTGDELDPRPYVRFERGALIRAIRDGRGHCDLIALHYARPGGVRSWLQSRSGEHVLTNADGMFRRLSEADGDLFLKLGLIGEALTNESRVIVNLVASRQPEVARQRVIEGRERLAPLEDDLQRSAEALQEIEHSLSFTRGR